MVSRSDRAGWLGACLMRLSALTVALAAAACTGPSTTSTDSGPVTEGTSPTGDPCLYEGTSGATSTCLAPSWPPEYYAEQASMYFDTLDVDASPDSIPNYAEDVARWEWPPWLKLRRLFPVSIVVSAKVRGFHPTSKVC